MSTIRASSGSRNDSTMRTWGTDQRRRHAVRPAQLVDALPEPLTLGADTGRHVAGTGHLQNRPGRGERVALAPVARAE